MAVKQLTRKQRILLSVCFALGVLGTVSIVVLMNFNVISEAQAAILMAGDLVATGIALLAYLKRV